MARAIWKGSIAFGLVQIPVELFVAEEPDELSFRQLDKHDFSPIGYDRINKRTGKKVAWNDIVRGFEWEKDEYVVLSDEELERANARATHTIDIIAFVDDGEVDPIYFERPYYVAPTKHGAKAYALLRETLAKNEQIGIAKVVIRTRQHLAALMTKGDALTLVQLRFAHELRPVGDLPLPAKSLDELGVSAVEQRMADMLVQGMHDEWKPEQYKDTFRDDVLALVEKKAKAGEVNTVAKLPHEKPVAQQNVVDLVEALKRSLAATPKKPGPKKATRPRKSGHRKSA